MGLNKIKYDKRDKKIYLIIAVVTTIIFVVCFSLLQMDLEFENLSAAFYAGFMVISTIFLPVISFAMWVMFFDSFTYLKRLEKHGFVIPDNKKDYDASLDKLPVKEDDYIMQVKDMKESNESKALAYISWFISLGMVGYTVWYFIRFSHMLDNVGFLGLFSIFITLCWLVFGFYFFKQRNADKYSDDVDYRSKLKVRKHLVEGLVTIVVLLAITVVGAVNMYTMSRYVERAKENPELVGYVEIGFGDRLDY